MSFVQTSGQGIREHTSSPRSLSSYNTMWRMPVTEGAGWHSRATAEMPRRAARTNTP